MPDTIPHPDCYAATVKILKDRAYAKRRKYFQLYYENVQKPKRKKAKEAGK